MTGPTGIEVLPTSPEQLPILANLLELYIHDFSDFMDLKIGADGRFGYPRLPLYWQEPHRHPFLVRVDGHWAGFALVCRGSQISGDDSIWDLAEFFILRGCRRLGVGQKAAFEVWNTLPGRWEVRVTDRNQPATAFWARAVAAFTGHPAEPRSFDQNGKRWHIFSFESKSGG